jgi:ABC-type multidrug transport system ATPase subunit
VLVQIPHDDSYKWGGIGYMAGMFIFFMFVSAWSLANLRSWLTTGTKREDALESDAGDAAVFDVHVGAKSSSMVHAADEHHKLEEGNQLPFQQMDLSFSDLRYTVTVTEQDDNGKPRTYERTLLDGVNGYAKAGHLTALMGSSGAGKTTLMDVIAGRKTTGTITGAILVNGVPQTFPSFNRFSGYCEQTDVHVGQHTVQEAIEFSAKLRLPPEVTDEQRTRFVSQILQDLELDQIAHRLVGDVSVEGLAPGERKRVTIGVELAANPTFLFLDEPTSGLNSRSARIVMRVIRKIAERGRSVICTIHQPSAELFGMFDRLLLLKSGGKEVYFGQNQC